jgi:hypothetical protein
MSAYLTVDESDQPVSPEDVFFGAGSNGLHVLLLDVRALVFAVDNLKK